VRSDNAHEDDAGMQSPQLEDVDSAEVERQEVVDCSDWEALADADENGQGGQSPTEDFRSEGLVTEEFISVFRDRSGSVEYNPPFTSGSCRNWSQCLLPTPLQKNAVLFSTCSPKRKIANSQQRVPGLNTQTGWFILPLRIAVRVEVDGLR
jgi:hypothetical protein